MSPLPDPTRFCRAAGISRAIPAESCRERMRRAAETENPLLCCADCEHRHLARVPESAPRAYPAQDGLPPHRLSFQGIVKKPSSATQAAHGKPGRPKSAPSGWHHCPGCLEAVQRGEMAKEDLRLHAPNTKGCTKHSDADRVLRIQRGEILPPHCKERMLAAAEAKGNRRKRGR